MPSPEFPIIGTPNPGLLLPGSPPPPASYTFRLDQYEVRATRSRHEDTNVASYTLQVGAESFTQTQGPTNVNDGFHDLCIEFPGLQIGDASTSITAAFAIVNAGHDSGQVENELKQGVNRLIVAEAGTGSIWGAAAMLAVDEALDLAFADCDGTVAAASITVPRSSFDAQIPANGRLLTSTSHYPGTESADGCGGNSDYYVTQTVIRTQPGDVTRPQELKLFILASRSSGLVLDVPGGARTDELQVQQWPDNGTVSQHWQLVAADSGYFVIVSAVSGLCLQEEPDGRVVQTSFQDAWNQHWKFEAVPVPPPNLPFPVLPAAPYYRCKARSTGRVLDVAWHSARPGVKMQTYAEKSSDINNQLWQLIGIANAQPVTLVPPGIR